MVRIAHRFAATVLVTGETGTGKELIARAIHRQSQRSSRPIVSVNCAANSRDLIGSESFGHEKSSLTGAVQRRLGPLAGSNVQREARSSSMRSVSFPSRLKSLCCVFLQEHEFERVGGTRSIQTNVRVIAATNRNLQAANQAATFRSDLVYRVNVFPIDMPPLRERREDIPLLVEYFVDHCARRVGKNIQDITKESLDLLCSYPWPANIRELQNVIERSVIMCNTENFPVDKTWLAQQPPATEPKIPPNLSEKVIGKNSFGTFAETLSRRSCSESVQ